MTGNISREATSQLTNILVEAMRHLVNKWNEVDPRSLPTGARSGALTLWTLGVDASAPCIT